MEITSNLQDALVAEDLIDDLARRDSCKVLVNGSADYAVVLVNVDGMSFVDIRNIGGEDNG